ncbi:MAG: Na+/H+ antiporter NhaA [Gemmatimonadota bacterium]
MERSANRVGPPYMNRARTRVTRAFNTFIEKEASGGIAILVAAIVALLVGNSRFGGAYVQLWHTDVGLSIGGHALRLSLQHWINDGLMTIFFFVVGLEIKREILVGELSTARKAALPVIGAAGGAALPALIYFALNHTGPYRHGWGIPMATDIAFAVGLLALLGSRAPLWLKTFVTALAIADDILAVLVIALFYSADLNIGALWWAGAMMCVLALLNRAGVRSTWAYVIPAIALWYVVLQSGVHATIAGVIAAAFVPASFPDETPERTASDLQKAFVGYARALAPFDSSEEGLDAKDIREEILRDLAREVTASEAPLYRLEHSLHPWVAFLILPLFAFANAGVRIPLATLGEALTHPLTLGVSLGLFFGKQIGITAAAWLAVRLGVAELAAGGHWRTLWGGALLAGVGFTMSIFIASLAFAEPEALDLAKIGILGGSVISGLAGYVALRAAPAGPNVREEVPMG